MIDFLLNKTSGDLLIGANGDFVFGQTDQQNQEDIISYAPGELKQFPLVGVNIDAYVNGNVNNSQLSQIIKQALQGDAFIVNSVNVINVNDIFNINIKAVRN